MKVGDYIPVWWATQDQINGVNYAMIVDIRPYTGVYRYWYTHILKLTALNRQYIEMTVDEEETKKVIKDFSWVKEKS